MSLLSYEVAPLAPVVIGVKTPARSNSKPLPAPTAINTLQFHVYNKAQLLAAVGVCESGYFNHIILHRADYKETHYLLDYRYARRNEWRLAKHIGVFKRRIRATPAEAFR